MAAESHKAIYAAIAANLAIATIKFTAALFAGITETLNTFSLNPVHSLQTRKKSPMNNSQIISGSAVAAEEIVSEV
jgi:hypothetical protein